MSEEYNEYLSEHIGNVRKGLNFLTKYMPELLYEEAHNGKNYIGYDLAKQFIDHDASKFSEEEYDAYDAYFYGGKKTKEVLDNFNRAWLHHIHHNPHHWQHYVLIQDDDETICVEMPYRYILEMICDWWAFSWKKGDLYEIFKWYEDHKKHIQLGPETRKKVEDILNRLRAKLAIERVML